MLIRMIRSLATRRYARSRPAGEPDAPPGLPADRPNASGPGRPAQSAYRGYYINLERSADRRRTMADRLQRLGLAERYERFPAVEGERLDAGRFKLRPGEAACFLSHLGVLEAVRDGDPHLHVIEDDVILGGAAARCLEAIIAHGLLDRYDLVYTDTLVPFKPDLVRHYLRLCEQAERGAAGGTGLDGVQLVDLRGRFYACHASYLVNARARARVSGLLRREVEAGMPLPVDIALKNLVNQGALKAAVTVPFLTATRLEETLVSTVQGTLAGAAQGEYEALVSVLLHNLLRNQFFVDRDDREFERYFGRYVAGPQLGGAGRNVARLAAFFLSRAHRDF